MMSWKKEDPRKAFIYDVMETTFESSPFVSTMCKFSRREGKKPTDILAYMNDQRVKLKQATRYTLDDDFVRAVVSMYPKDERGFRRMISAAKLANLPYKSVWVSYNIKARLQAAKLFNPLNMYDENYSDQGVHGFLLSRLGEDTSHFWEAQPYLAGDKKFSYAVPAPLTYILNTETQDVYTTFCNRLKLNQSLYDLLPTLVNSAWGIFDATDAPHARLSIQQLHAKSVCLPSRAYGGHFKQDRIREAGNASMGDLRFLTLVISALTHGPIQYIRHSTPSGSYKRRLNNIPFMDHHEVILRCERTKTIRLYDRSILTELQRRRRHTVEGHWRAEYSSSRPCRHEDIADRDGKYALCAQCGKLLTWITEHDRGDATLGWVQKSYKVKR